MMHRGKTESGVGGRPGMMSERGHGDSGMAALFQIMQAQQEQQQRWLLLQQEEQQRWQEEQEQGQNKWQL